MSFKRILAGIKPLRLFFSSPTISFTGTAPHKRLKMQYRPPRIKPPPWLPRRDRAGYDEMLTSENEKFLQEIVTDLKKSPSPLVQEPIPRGEWFPSCRRSGLIGIKLGTTSQWLTNGKHILTTVIQILENQVIRYIPPETLMKNKRRRRQCSNLGGLVVGAVDYDPQLCTKEYMGLFSNAGTMPKKKLVKFYIHPSAAIQPGTPLYAAHFKVGDIVDVFGITKARGFLGVMKRWGFHGMPASHGQTKTHRRGGNIGGAKAKVWRGTKMPGHEGLKPNTIRGFKVLRMDHRHNIIYLRGQGVPGEINSFVYLYDTVLPQRKLKKSPRFPTYYPDDYKNNPLPSEEFDSSLFDFSTPTILFEEETKFKKK